MLLAAHRRTPTQEMYTRNEPFADEHNPLMVAMNTVKGKTHKIPAYVPPTLKVAMQQCWAYEPKSRIKLEELVRVIEALVKTS